MYLNQLRQIQPFIELNYVSSHRRWFGLQKVLFQTTKPQEIQSPSEVLATKEEGNVGISNKQALINEIFPTARVMPMVISNKEPAVLSFEDVPGPKSLKYISVIRQYFSGFGTQLTASALTMTVNIRSLTSKNSRRDFSLLFDEYGPVVRFVSPVGNDIVLINHPDHIQKVYNMEGDYPVRSTLDSLEKYRREHRSHMYGGLYSVHGQEWSKQRSVVYSPLHSSVSQHLQGINDVCENFSQKIYNMRNYQNELPKDLYKELHKWAFDCMGLILFSKRFTMLDTELVYSQCDMSWLYHSLEKATEAITKCETGLQLWKMFPTPAWNSLVKYCDSLDNLIGKHVIEAEQSLSFTANDNKYEMAKDSLINAMLLSERKMNAEDVATIIMDMFLIGVNTISSSMAFLLYHLGKFQKAQKPLWAEVDQIAENLDIDLRNITERTPYLQACIKETLRLVPPIPVITRILPKNITLDRYNIPRGTLIIMSTRDSSLKEGNYDNAATFNPERWLKDDGKEYHAFASIPFGFGARKCLGQNIAESMMSLLTIRIVQKYRLEYHYGDIQPTKSFLSKPNKPLKLRFIDRV